MTADSPVAYETSVRARQALIAALAAGLLLAGTAATFAGPQPKVSELTVQLIFVNKRFPLDLIGAVINAFSLVALIATLLFLFRATLARRPETSPALRIAVLVGGILFAIVGVVSAAVIAIKSHQFVTHGTQTYEQANSLTGGAALPGLQLLGFVAQFILPGGLMFIAVNAMRVGLLTRFMGYFGVIVGVMATPIGQAIFGPVVVVLQVFWLGSLTYLFAGRWPGGDPPAWRTGQAVPWPTSVQPREQRAKAAGARREKPAPAAEPEPAQTAGRTRATTPKRKRKRRR